MFGLDHNGKLSETTATHLKTPSWLDDIAEEVDDLWLNYKTDDYINQNFWCGERWKCVKPSARPLPPPRIFQQGNVDAFHALLDTIVSPPNRFSHVADVFGGDGFISDYLRRRGNFFSSTSSKIDVFDITTTHDAIDLYRTPLPNLCKYDCLLLDPPRKKGLGSALFSQLSQAPEKTPSNLFYFSCHFPTVEADLKRMPLHYRVESATAQVLFPGANHIETLIHLVKQD
jgi:hypothetical protein